MDLSGIQLEKMSESKIRLRRVEDGAWMDCYRPTERRERMILGGWQLGDEEQAGGEEWREPNEMELTQLGQELEEAREPAEQPRPHPWADPRRRSEDYPGLVVHDSRVSGSITFTDSRLPLWAVLPDMVQAGFPAILHNWDYLTEEYGWDAGRLAAFLVDLLEMRGEFGRLLLVLADMERLDSEREQRAMEATPDGGTLPHTEPWWEHQELRERVQAALHACLNALQPEGEKSELERLREERDHWMGLYLASEAKSLLGD